MVSVSVSMRDYDVLAQVAHAANVSKSEYVRSLLQAALYASAAPEQEHRLAKERLGMAAAEYIASLADKGRSGWVEAPRDEAKS